MKKELLKTINYLLVVDDSEIKEGDWMYRNNEEPILVTPNFWWDFQAKYCKIIAHLPLKDSPILEGVPLLPPLEVEDDVESMAKDYLFNDYQKQFKVESNDEQFGVLKGYRDGYNKAKETYKFTEEDMRKAADWYFETNGEKPIEELIQSLSQPKMPTHFEFDTVCDQCLDDDSVDSCYCHYGSYKIVPKTITNSQGQVMVCGKYIY